jgi:lipopolysaccharide transport system ATP-binding protein
LPISSDAGGGVAVRAEGLGKQYRLAAPQEKYRTLRETLARRAARLRPGKGAPSGAARSELFWALRDASLTVRRGQAVGIIGHNGSGKSTLLKILSRVTQPTAGRAEIRGRVGTLLEVGTGFHNELTGRENIFLSGAILGMRRREMAARFDEIVEFAEVSRFIDTPVKRYSSGMYLRLAFAVAAHMEPEVLIIDEVLAVGDAAFQRKCLGRMSDVAGDGRTVLFVSHDLDAVQRLCSECVLLEDGQIVAHGASEAVVREYLARAIGRLPAQAGWIDLTGVRRSGTGEARFTAAKVLAGNGHDPVTYPDGPLQLELRIDSDAARTVGSMAVSVETLSGTKLIEADLLAIGGSLRLRGGSNRVQFVIPELHLNPGRYAVRLWLGQSATSAFDHLPTAFQFDVGRPPASAATLPPTAGLVPCRFEVTQDA